jgi:serine O-acetyltransferase
LSRALDRLIGLRGHGLVGWVVRLVLSTRGTEIPACVPIGSGLRLPHGGRGVVIHPTARIGLGVTIYHNVTIGRVDAWKGRSYVAPIVVGDGAVLCTGAVVLGGRRALEIGPGTVLGANAVLTQSTGPNEVWAGVPARRMPNRSADDI